MARQESKTRQRAREARQPCVVQWQRPDGSFHRDPYNNVPAACDRANALRRQGIRALVYTLNEHGANQAFVDEGCLTPVAASKEGK